MAELTLESRIPDSQSSALPPIPATLPLIDTRCQPNPSITHTPLPKGCIGLKGLASVWGFRVGRLLLLLWQEGKGQKRSKSSSPILQTCHQVLLLAPPHPPNTHTFLKFQCWLIYFIALYMTFPVLTLFPLSAFICLPMNCLSPYDFKQIITSP